MIILIMLLTALVVLNSIMLFFVILPMAQQHKNERQTCSTDAGLMDAMATQYDVFKYLELRKLRLQAALRETEAAEERAHKVVTILGETRQGPYAYDRDKPAGRRPSSE